MTKKIRENIIEYMEESEKNTFTIEELSKGLELNRSQDFKYLVQTVASLERDNVLQFTKDGKVRLPKKTLLLEGVFRGNEKGFGFVSIENEDEDIFIPANATNYALDGDTVAVDIIAPADYTEKRGPEGKVKKILKRGLTQLVGEFYAYTSEEIEETDLYGYILPKDKKLEGYRIYIAAEGIKPVDGSVCIVEIKYYPEKGYNKALEGVVTKEIGHKDDPGMDILSIVFQHGIPIEFDEEVLKEAEAISDTVKEQDLIGRKDRRNQTIVTIDGEDAKDLDDAVTVHKLENGNYFLGVHIADVSYYVKKDSPLDQSAYTRGTSVYLTDRVIPMLPHRLSNGICSLNPKVPRLTISCEMEIDSQGKVVSYDIFPSVIQTNERMTYAAVNQILEDQDTEVRERYQTLVPMFEEMADLHHILEEMRSRRGAISFDDQEAQIMVDSEGHPTEIALRQRGTGERMIESFMLAANETVAEHFFKQKLPFIYRIHEQPAEDKMQRFLEFATNFGIMVKGTKENIQPKTLQEVLEQIAGKPEEPVVNMMLLRSMKQARYSEEAEGHYGLAAEYYTHFTSPIRRYPDLIVHRLIRAYSSLPVKEETKILWEEILPDIADHSSKMERRSVEAERDTDALKKAEFMMDKVGQEFEGVISSVTKFGFFVELPNTVEGLIHMNQMKNDYYHFIESHLALVGERTGTTYRIGQKVIVKVVKSDPVTREIDFELLSAEDSDSLVSKLPQREKKTRSRKENSKDKSYSKKKNRKKKPFYKGVSKKKK